MANQSVTTSITGGDTLTNEQQLGLYTASRITNLTRRIEADGSTSTVRGKEADLSFATTEHVGPAMSARQGMS